MSSYRSLVDKYEKIKHELGEAEVTIRRLTGRDFPEEKKSSVSASAPASLKFRLGSSASVSGRPPFSNTKRSYQSRIRSRERDSDVSSYEVESSEDESPTSKKPALQSTVVAKRHQKRTRIATIEQQSTNSKLNARNRRMFGALIGTLEKFKSEEKQREHKESMRVEIEKKVELANEEERERIKREKEHLFVSRREKKSQLRCLEKKIERAESHEVFDANHRYLLNFIVTKAKPAIFFLPSKHNSATKKALEKSKSKIQEIIKKKKQSFEKDLSEIEESYRKDSSLPAEKENKHPKKESQPKETVPKSLIVLKEVTGQDCIIEKNVSAEDGIQITTGQSGIEETEVTTDQDCIIEMEVTGQDCIIDMEVTDQDGNVKLKSDNDSNSDSESEVNNDENSSNTKNIVSLADQDFEPIYDP